MSSVCALETARLDSYLNGIDYLPPTPTLMIRLIGLFQQPDRDVDEVIELMRQDPSLTAEVLRRCNTSFFGNEEPVTDINEAVFRLGFYEVYRITVALFGMQSMSLAQVARNFEVETLWRHSALTAIVGGAMARELGESEGIIFTAGLLHDAGKIVLASAEGPKYAALLREHGLLGTATNEAEKAAFGFNHCEIGAQLLHRWGVPEQVYVPVLCHHEASWSGPYERASAIVTLANLMARCMDGAAPDKPCELPEAVHAMELLGLKHEDMPRLEHLARSDMKRLSSLLTTGGSH